MSTGTATNASAATNAMPPLNATHDPALKSWVQSANQPGTDFPIQNLPFAVFRKKGSATAFRGGVAIGDQILDLAALHEARVLQGSPADALAACAQPTLNNFMALGPDAWSALRAALSRLLSDGPTTAALVAQSEA